MESRAAGWAEGHTEALHTAVIEVLATRGIPVSHAFPGRLVELEDVSDTRWCGRRFGAGTRRISCGLPANEQVSRSVPKMR